METKVMRVPSSVVNTLRELSNRTGLEMVDLLSQIFGTVQKQLDEMEPNKRLLFMVDLYRNRNTIRPFTIVRMSDALMSSFNDLPPEIQSKVLEGFSYKMVDGHLVDTTEKPRVQQIPQPPEEQHTPTGELA